MGYSPQGCCCSPWILKIRTKGRFRSRFVGGGVIIVAFISRHSLKSILFQYTYANMDRLNSRQEAEIQKTQFQPKDAG